MLFFTTFFKSYKINISYVNLWFPSRFRFIFDTLWFNQLFDVCIIFFLHQASLKIHIICLWYIIYWKCIDSISVYFFWHKIYHLFLVFRYIFVKVYHTMVRFHHIGIMHVHNVCSLFFIEVHGHTHFLNLI